MGKSVVSCVSVSPLVTPCPGNAKRAFFDGERLFYRFGIENVVARSRAEVRYGFVFFARVGCRASYFKLYFVAERVGIVSRGRLRRAVVNESIFTPLNVYLAGGDDYSYYRVAVGDFVVGVCITCGYEVFAHFRYCGNLTAGSGRRTHIYNEIEVAGQGYERNGSLRSAVKFVGVNDIIVVVP